VVPAPALRRVGKPPKTNVINKQTSGARRGGSHAKRDSMDLAGLINLVYNSESAPRVEVENLDYHRAIKHFSRYDCFIHRIRVVFRLWFGGS
jgi:hypothetical protein